MVKDCHCHCPLRFQDPFISVVIGEPHSAAAAAAVAATCTFSSHSNNPTEHLNHAGAPLKLPLPACLYGSLLWPRACWWPGLEEHIHVRSLSLLSFVCLGNFWDLDLFSLGPSGFASSKCQELVPRNVENVYEGAREKRGAEGMEKVGWENTERMKRKEGRRRERGEREQVIKEPSTKYS